MVASTSLSTNTFFEYYIFHFDQLDDPKDKAIALISSITLGFITLGLFHLFCYLALYDRQIGVKKRPDPIDDKTSKVFDKVVKESSETKDPSVLPKTNLEEAQEKPLDVENSTKEKEKGHKKKLKKTHSKKEVHFDKSASAGNIGKKTVSVPHLTLDTVKKSTVTKTKSAADVKLKRKDSRVSFGPEEKKPHTKLNPSPREDNSDAESLTEKEATPRTPKDTHSMKSPRKVKAEPETFTYEKKLVNFADFKKSAEEGNVHYQLFLGEAYLFGKEPFVKSNTISFYWFQKASEHKDAPAKALYRAGKMIYKGFGTEKSKSKGRELLEKASEMNYQKAIDFLKNHPPA